MTVSLCQTFATVPQDISTGGRAGLAQCDVLDAHASTGTPGLPAREPEDRAIAGLSMRGGQTANIAFSKPELFRTFRSTDSCDEWTVWRHHLNELAPLLFK